MMMNFFSADKPKQVLKGYRGTKRRIEVNDNLEESQSKFSAALRKRAASTRHP